MSREGSVAGEGWPGNEPVELGASIGIQGDMGGTGDWRYRLMRELRAFTVFLMTCEAGIAPSRTQRAECVLRLDALSVALHEPSYCDINRYEVEVALAGNGESVTLRPREIEALGWRQKGLSPKEIAREMGITLLTVRSYIRDAASKLDASGWEAAVRKAIELGIL